MVRRIKNDPVELAGQIEFVLDSIDKINNELKDLNYKLSILLCDLQQRNAKLLNKYNELQERFKIVKGVE